MPSKLTLTCIYRKAECSMLRFELFFSSCCGGSCFLSSSKHSLRCARRFFSSLLCTSRVPDRIPPRGIGLRWGSSGSFSRGKSGSSGESLRISVKWGYVSGRLNCFVYLCRETRNIGRLHGNLYITRYWLSCAFGNKINDIKIEENEKMSSTLPQLPSLETTFHRKYPQNRLHICMICLCLGVCIFHIISIFLLFRIYIYENV